MSPESCVITELSIDYSGELIYGIDPGKIVIDYC